MKKTYQELNEEQRNAVFHNAGPALILAGAGSGKTRVVTFRIVRLIEELNVSPFRILAVTFTNKAAQEMRERVAHLAGKQAKEIFIGTFHALCLNILKIHADKLGYKPGFTIYDDSDQKALIKECLWDLKLDEKLVNPQAVHSFISAAKNELRTPKDYEETAAGVFMERVAQIYPRYQKKLMQNNAMDFDDMLFNAVTLLQKYPDVLEGYRKRFEYISVDEYQDINTSQYQLISMIAHPLNNLCVVGDPDQSIYGWRGADIRNILKFEQDFKGAKIFKLQQNYRSTRSIIQAAQSVIQNNSQRKEKELFSLREMGETPTYYQAEDDNAEAEFVMKTIYERLGQPGRAFRHVAVLYRTNAQSRSLEMACRAHNIPYVIVGGMKFFDRKEVKDMLAYFHVLANPQDSISLRRMINVPMRGIGSGTVEKLEASAKEQDLTLLEAARKGAVNGEFPKKTAQALASFVGMMDELVALKAVVTPYELVKTALEKSGYLTDLASEETNEARMRVENLKELVNSVAEYEKNAEGKGEPPSLEGYLDQVSLVADVDKLEDNKNCVTLMTMHNAKGLEYPIVFVTGMEDGLFPHQNSIDADEKFRSDEKIQEERRLCYVALTRAMDILYLTGSASRRVFGEVHYRRPSRFIDEIPKDMLQYSGRAAGMTLTHYGTYEVANANKKEFDELKDPEWDDAPAEIPFNRGDMVRHSKFGEGMVLEVEGSFATLKVTVSFPNHGKKKLDLKIAKLQKVE